MAIKAILTTVLTFCLLPYSADAKHRKRATTHRGRHTTAHHRGPTIRESCPPPTIITKPDSVTVFDYSDEAQLQATVAEWLRSQPEMSEAATNAARAIALFWWRRGRASIK